MRQWLTLCVCPMLIVGALCSKAEDKSGPQAKSKEEDISFNIDVRFQPAFIKQHFRKQIEFLKEMAKQEKLWSTTRERQNAWKKNKLFKSETILGARIYMKHGRGKTEVSLKRFREVPGTIVGPSEIADLDCYPIVKVLYFECRKTLVYDSRWRRADDKLLVGCEIQIDAERFKDKLDQD